jgi:pyrroloquinoline quinone (PQQ) biosynthesis protein C
MTMPYDGRPRPTSIERDPSAASPEEFETAFCEALVGALMGTGIKSGPPAGLSHAEARLWHGTYLKYMSFFAWKFPSWLMSVASLCPYQDVRAEIIKDCVDEEVGDVDADGSCHIDVLYEEAAVCGISREDILSTEPTPPMIASIMAWENMTRTLGWVPGFAAIAGLEIVNSEPAIKVRERLSSAAAVEQMAQDMGGQAFNEKLGLEQSQLKFLALHSYKDRFHGGGELRLLVKYANTRALQEEAIWAATTSAKIFGVHGVEVRRLAGLAVGATS